MSKASGKNFVAALIIIVMGLSLFATDIFTPGLPAMATQFNVAEASAKQTISVFYLAFAFGQLVFGPLSDYYGRRRVFLGALTLLLVSTVVCALSSSLDELLLGRVLQALGACAGGVVGRAVLSELFSGNELIKVMSTMVMVKALAPAVAPILGGFLVPVWGWASTFWALAMITLIVLVLVFRFLPETNAGTTKGAKPALGLRAAYGRLMRNRNFLRYSIAPALLNGGLVALVACSPFIFISRFDTGERTYGLLQGGHIGVFILGAVLSRRYAERHGDGDGVEQGLMVALATYAMLVCILAATLGNGIGVLMMLLGTLGFCLVMGFTNPLLYAKGLASFKGNAGTDSSVQGFIYYGVGAVVGTVTNYFTTDSPLSLFLILALSAAMAIISLVLLRPHPVAA